MLFENREHLLVVVNGSTENDLMVNLVDLTMGMIYIAFYLKILSMDKRSFPRFLRVKAALSKNERDKLRYAK